MRAALMQHCILALGLAVLGAPLSQAQTTIVSSASVWKYLDDGSNQDIGWRGLAFDDGAWAAGPAPLGYGDGDEATVVNSGPDTNRFITTYFRQTFQVADPLAFTNLVVQLLRDDGAVVYLNGTEIFRSNMPTNEIDFLTLALTSVQPVGETTNFYSKLVSSDLMLPGVNVLAVEVHQWSATGSDLSFDLALLGNVMGMPPSVTLTCPTNATVIVTENVTIKAEAYDTTAAIAGVSFFEGDNLLGEAAAPPYAMTWSNAPQGSYVLTAVATGEDGLSSTSAPVAILIPKVVAGGSIWKYLDDGSDQRAAWQETDFDDSAWSEGPAQLGYGSSATVTAINGGPDTNRIITYYFRRNFEVIDPTAYTNLVLRLLRDDGGIVYLNGVEVFRSNMPDGLVGYLTWAASVVPYGPQESEFYATSVDPGLLISGTNVLAVEIHQANNTSSDLNFDLELIPNIPPTPPTITITGFNPPNNLLLAPATLDIRAEATDFDSTVSQVNFYLGNKMLGRSATEPFGLRVTNLTAGRYALWAFATDTSGLAGTSAPVMLTVMGGPGVTTLIATGSIWKYLDSGPANPDPAWSQPGFDDGLWAAGPGILGYGNATKGRPEATVIRSVNPTTGAKIVTDYFRHQFFVANPLRFTNLAFRVLRDDGLVAYLNGAEIFRMNMPLGLIGPDTLTPALVGGTNEVFRFPANVSPAFLLAGTNLLAVELHQGSPSSDAAFDLQLDGIAPPTLGPGRLAISNSDAGLVITWGAGEAFLEQAEGLGGPWENVTYASPYVAVPATARSMFFRLRQP